MSCPECESNSSRLDWRWKVGVVSLVAGILLNFVHLPPESGMQKWLEFLDGILLGSAVVLVIVAFFKSRKKSDI
jgi:uncharacterized membrane protein HdeD (DUF308 family)